MSKLESLEVKCYQINTLERMLLASEYSPANTSQCIKALEKLLPAQCEKKVRLCLWH